MDSERQVERGEAFRELHRGPRILVLPNAWDVGSARVFADVGFPALATTSSGVAQTLGLPDGQRITRDDMLAVVARIAAAVSIPVSADLEAGYGTGPDAVAETIRLAIEVGVVGANIEDGTGQGDEPLLESSLAAERIAAAREAADATGVPFVINARTDGFLARGTGDPRAFEGAVHRANLYLRAGADCAFVPGVADVATISRLAREIDGPLNVLAGPGTPPVRELETLGVARVSIGGAIARASLGLAKRAAEELLRRGTYGFTADSLTRADLTRILDRGSR
jgi:2-methylisocitrate lyase-like PEP mutase family enzyme